MKKLNMIVVVVALSLFTTSAQAYKFRSTSSGVLIKWPWALYPDLDFEVVGLGPLDLAYEASKKASGLWQVAPTVFDFNVDPGDSVFGFQNSENEIALTSDQTLLGGQSSRCLMWYDTLGGEIYEADIIVDEDVDWGLLDNYDGSPYAASGRESLIGRLAKEMGHAAGLLSEHRIFGIMGDSDRHVWAYQGDLVRHFVGGNAGKGASVLYGAWGSSTRYAISDYTQGRGHGRQRARRGLVLASDATSVRPVSIVDGQPVYRVWPAAGLQLETTVQNIGSTSVALGYSTYLFSLPGFSVNLLSQSPSEVYSLGDVRTKYFSTQIPGDTAQGHYYLSAVLPDNGSLRNRAEFEVEVVPVDGVCSPTQPCGKNGGDCDFDSDCQSGMICVNNIGAQFGVSWWVDICQPPQGDWSYCSESQPCGPGKGDCDNGPECLSGVCDFNVGAQYGFASGVDVCQ